MALRALDTRLHLSPDWMQPRLDLVVSSDAPEAATLAGGSASDTPFGAMHVRWRIATGRVVWIGFGPDSKPPALRDDAEALRRVRAVLDHAPGLAVEMCGTPFQHSVWAVLLRIPRGQVVSYGALAAALGKPKASRAVGSAVGANPLSLLIPCHRVVPADGQIGQYLWGSPLKEILLRSEGVRFRESD